MLPKKGTEDLRKKRDVALVGVKIKQEMAQMLIGLILTIVGG